MKKTLLFLGLVLAAFSANAQFEVRDKSDDSIVTDGQTISFSEAGCGYSDPCNWKFKVTNTSTENIYMRIFVDNLVGTDGSLFQLCFAGVCLNNVTLYSGYPNTAAMIAPGATNSAGNNFWNQNPPTTTTPMSWTLRFQAFNASGMEIGTPLSVIYNFDPSLSINESSLATLDVYPTNTKNELNVNSNENLTADFYDLLGKNIKQVNIVSGDNTIDISDLSAQPYIIRFTNEEGNSIIKKIVKQ
ncbi:T9SS type A sorting domain-containing protein [Winogradskyella psychrotolerans]|uniref:T9SS type A sorting domain-containing protein n=1 Tax=Winogradskyella TaxID=286104 RepID=UPI001C06B513|nr:T9SS type A sorting domain-containing protein [Winogradskyella psychrotolerans]MBU2922900.1 T9SS type A sorting domain-containing protein [Winogradskyella psychrotolerans]